MGLAFARSLLFVLIAFSAAAAPPKSFDSARDDVARLYASHRVTFYCGCAFDSMNRIRPAGCGYDPRRDTARSRRVELEHIVPAKRLGEAIGCGSRQNCRKTSERFNRAEGDLMNIVPAIGELNAVRWSHPFGIVPGEAREFGACDFEASMNVVEPAPSIRGDIARIWFYMDHRYGLALTDDELWMFIEWASTDPIDEWERHRWKAILDIEVSG